MLGRLLCWLGFHDWSWTHKEVVTTDWNQPEEGKEYTVTTKNISLLGQCIRCKTTLEHVNNKEERILSEEELSKLYNIERRLES